MPVLDLSDEDVAAYNRDGFVIVPKMFDDEEIANLNETIRIDAKLREHAIGLDDGSGGQSRLTIWYEAGDDTYGMFARCERIVKATERFFGCAPLFFHSKVMMKEPRIGGAWSWHQDYGYWYADGFIYPDMLSCLIAVDPATRENGCLQVLRGSHRLGRIDHCLVGEQTGAETERLALALEEFPCVFCELNPGDTLFFHGNLLHGSEQNRSEHPRISLITCYTASHNTPRGPRRALINALPIRPIADSQILKVGAKTLQEAQSFLNQADIGPA